MNNFKQNQDRAARLLSELKSIVNNWNYDSVETRGLKIFLKKVKEGGINLDENFFNEDGSPVWGFGNIDDASLVFKMASTVKLRQYCRLWIDYLGFEEVSKATVADAHKIYAKYKNSLYSSKILELRMSPARRVKMGLQKGSKSTGPLNMCTNIPGTFGVGKSSSPY